MVHRRARDIKSRVSMAKAELNKKKIIFHQAIGLKFKNKLLKRCVWSVEFCGAEM